MTTLELARAIADAVLATTHRRNRNSIIDAPTQAVLSTLRANGSWFSRASSDDVGVWKGETERNYPAVGKR